MPEIDPDRPPLSVEELQRDAAAAGADPDAPPLVDAEAPPAAPGSSVESDVTLLPPG